MRWRLRKPAKPRVKPKKIEQTSEERELFEERVLAIVTELYKAGRPRFPDEEASVSPQEVRWKLYGPRHAPSPEVEAGRRNLIRNTLLRLTKHGFLETYQGYVHLDLRPLGKEYGASYGTSRMLTCYRPANLLSALAVASKPPSARKRTKHHTVDITKTP